MMQVEPGLTPDEIEFRLEASGTTVTDDFDPNNVRTTPRVDARVALLTAGGDYDGDGCSDLDELNAVASGGDPFNPANFDGDLPPYGNGTAGIDNGPNVNFPAPDDRTVPNSDTVADGCDADDDNDSLADLDELSPTACGAFDLSTTSHPNPARGDYTDDDNGDGNPAPGNGSDAADNGPSWDTDGDGVRDGVECALGANPRSAASKPTAGACGGTTDADLDGLTARAERCKWGTADGVVDSDGDGRADCVEANDTNGDGVQNYAGDAINSAKAAFGQIGKTLDYDLNGDGAVNFPGDSTLSAKMAFHTDGLCPY
jgi:hypothetical protein